jgi:hypothetical protein
MANLRLGKKTFSCYCHWCFTFQVHFVVVYLHMYIGLVTNVCQENFRVICNWLLSVVLIGASKRFFAYSSSSIFIHFIPMLLMPSGNWTRRKYFFFVAPRLLFETDRFEQDYSRSFFFINTFDRNMSVRTRLLEVFFTLQTKFDMLKLIFL